MVVAVINFLRHNPDVYNRDSVFWSTIKHNILKTTMYKGEGCVM
jgi:hypothetical protein